MELCSVDETSLLEDSIKYSKHEILLAFDEKIDVFHELADAIKPLLKNILKNNNILYEDIKPRVKKKDSLEEKIIRKAKQEVSPKFYQKLDEIHDILGLRIVLYYEDDIDKVAQLIQSEFKEDTDNSVDKRNHTHDCFGYLSLHQVVELSDERLQYIEYKKFKSIKFEIQTRTVLQDAWAEIEHKLGYKSKNTLTYDQKRMLSQFAASLEVIDKGFIKLKTNNEQIISHNHLFEIIRSNNIIFHIDHLVKGRLYFSEDDRWTFDDILKHLNMLDITTIDQIQQTLKEKENKLILFIDQILDKAIPIQFTNGVSLIYLCQYIAIEKFSKEEFIEYVDRAEMRYGKQAELYYERLLLCYKRANFIYEFDLKERI